MPRTKKVNTTQETKEPVTSSTKKFAVIAVAGAQFIVEEGNTYEVRSLNLEKGAKVVDDKVLLVADGDNVLVGKPFVDGAKVEYVVDAVKKGPKDLAYIYKAKSRYRKTHGFREEVTKILVKKIQIS